MIRVLTVLAITVAASWIALLAALALARPDGATLADGLKVLPETVSLVRRLSTDPQLPRSVRRTLWFLGGYLAMPVDLVPDFIPVLGYADDAILVAVVLRSTVRRAGIDAVRAHWPGSEDGFAALRRITGLPEPQQSTPDGGDPV